MGVLRVLALLSVGTLCILQEEASATSSRHDDGESRDDSQGGREDEPMEGDSGSGGDEDELSETIGNNEEAIDAVAAPFSAASASSDKPKEDPRFIEPVPGSENPPVGSLASLTESSGLGSSFEDEEEEKGAGKELDNDPAAINHADHAHPNDPVTHTEKQPATPATPNTPHKAREGEGPGERTVKIRSTPAVTSSTTTSTVLPGSNAGSAPWGTMLTAGLATASCALALLVMS